MKIGDKVCIWFDCENGQRMGTPGSVEDVDSFGAVTVKYYVLGEFMTRKLSAGKARTHISKIDD